MVINNGNLQAAIYNVLLGYWLEVNKKCTYNFSFKSTEPEEMVVSMNYATPNPCKVIFEEGICYVEIQNVKYRLWLNDEIKDTKVELHSKKAKLKLARID